MTGISYFFTKKRFCDIIFLQTQIKNDLSSLFFISFILGAMHNNTRKEILPLNQTTKLWLRLALPFILLASIAILISYLDARAQNTVLANLYYPATMEYIFASLFITLCGAFLIEVAERDLKKRNDP